MMSLLVAAAAGALMVLAYPTHDWGWVSLPALAALLWAVRASSGWLNAGLAGLGFGLAFFGLLIPWLGELGVVAVLPLVVLQATLLGLFAAALKRWGVEQRPWVWWAQAVGGWALLEWFRSRYPLGGFEWGLAGYALSGYPPARGAAQWLGTSGWSVLLVALAGGAVVAVGRPGSRRPLLAASGVVALVLLAGAAFPAVAEGEVVRVAVVQGSTPCPGADCENERYRTYQRHLALTRTIPAGSVDLVVWPESSTGAVRADPVLSAEVGEAIGAEAARIGAVFIVGGDRAISDTHFLNVNVVFDRQGRIVGEYQKRHAVPFGEYIPARSFFADLIPALSQVPRDMVPGAGPVVWDLGFGPFGSVISFESAFSRYSRDTVLAGARLLVVATNQGSYPYSPASDQLIGMTRMRSAELGVDVVHSAVTGRSVIISDGGETGRRTGLTTSEVLTGEVRMRDAGLTLYARAGDWLQVTAAVAALLVTVTTRWRRERVAAAEERVAATRQG